MCSCLVTTSHVVNIPTFLSFVVSVMKHKGINIRKRRGKCKESEEVGSKWTKKEG